MNVFHSLTIACVLWLAPEEQPINPVPRAALTTKLAEWTFDSDSAGWTARHDCQLSAAEGLLKIRSIGEDPYFDCAVDMAGRPLLLKIKARGRTDGGGTVYWTTNDSPRGEDKTAHFPLIHDGQWHEYQARFVVRGRLTNLRIDPGVGPGEFEIDEMQLFHEEPHPLTIDRAETVADAVRFHVRNHRATALAFSTLGRQHTIEGGATVMLEVPLARRQSLEAASLELRAPDLPPVRRTLFVPCPAAPTEWVVRPADGFALRVARDGRLARVERDGQLLALLAPLVHCDHELPALRLTSQEKSIRFEGEGISVDLEPAGQEIRVTIRGRRRCTGPVVRVTGPLEQGLLAGVEYLGKGETSSSKLDVETEEHLRFAPDPIKVTLPLMAFVTSEASVAMTWTNMDLQATFATPNFYDCAQDHRMALEGEQIQATLRIDRSPLEEAILWATKKQGLPQLPAPPRSSEQQFQLCLAALRGPLRNAQGWGHCVEASWQRQPYAPMASTLWRLTGEAPQLERLVPGGSHVDNDAIYFVTGRARQWHESWRQRVQAIMRRQEPDGSFRYNGEFRRGHFENTASGVCAHPAAELLEYAWLTGDEAARAAGVRTLEFMKRFRTPRGAQVWEVPLHTPDQLASAHLVSAYVRGFELTGNRDYLLQSRKWALSGVPFVYLWGRHPIMTYATPPVLGATHWRAPCWIGRPVQWVGGVYAYALTKLAPYDDSLDWRHLARGILIAAEQMQYPDGPYAGLLPDAFDLKNQARIPARINPCALVSLRLVLDGQLDSLAVAADERHRVVSPFPITLREGKARIRARAGVAYQLLVDGQRIVDVASQGEDVVALE